MQIRLEQAKDIADIDLCNRAAFDGPAEAQLVAALRADGDSEISLVAEQAGQVVGHIQLSPMTAPWPTLGLGPVSVLPSYQHQGIGSDLIREGLALATKADWQMVFLLGDPAFYHRFGFRVEAAKAFASPYAGRYFQVLGLTPNILAGKSAPVAYAPAFSQI